MYFDELTAEDLQRMQEVDIQTVNTEGPTINDKMEEYIRRLAEVYI